MTWVKKLFWFLVILYFAIAMYGATRNHFHVESLGVVIGRNLK